jgi:hypothetical protein
MPYQLSWTNNPKVPDGINDKHSNGMPTPFREIDWHEFIYYSGRYCIQFIDNERWVLNFPKPDQSITLTIYWYHDFGVGFTKPSGWHLKGQKIVYNEDVKYFYFGCEHQNRELSYQDCLARKIYHGGRCYHVVECVKCKRISAYDSSD